MSAQASEINNELIKISDELKDLYFSFFKSHENENSEKIKSWETKFDQIKKNINDQVLKIAVVGAIKSGKSTFVNSFLKSDFLKRGAGVITSVVTRVRFGSDVKATVTFKSIEEINKDIKNSIVLLPDFDMEENFDDFDIRDENSRTRLKKILEKLNAEQLMSGDSREAKSVYLQSYILGYDFLADILENGFKDFYGKEFDEYKEFASKEPLAVYVKDILVVIPENSIDEQTEIADCQGSDSTNPLHIARIQDYLLRANFILYLVSTRTGLRQADIKFLNMLKKMGLTDQAVFILNTDLSEHDNFADIKRVEQNTIEELKMIQPEANFFTISALFELFTENKSTLSKKDALRLEQWLLDEESTKYLHDNFSEFKKYFDNEIILKKLFFSQLSSLRKLDDFLKRLQNRLDIKKKLINEEVSKSLEELKDQEKKFVEVKNLIKNTLEGSRQKFDKDLKSEVDKFFDFHSNVTGLVYNFIKTYVQDFSKYITKTNDNFVKINYFSLYQDFKQNLDNYVTQEVNPGIIAFVREKENEILSYYYKLSKSYESLVFEVKQNFERYIKKDSSIFVSRLTDPENYKNDFDLNIPSAQDALDYSISIRTNALAGSGFVFFKNLFGKIFKSKKSPEENAVKVLEKSLEKIKKETEESIKSHFLNYRENLKFQYILKFSKEVMDFYYDALTGTLDSYIADFSNILSMLEKDSEAKSKYTDEINLLLEECKKINGFVKSAEEKINNSVPQA